MKLNLIILATLLFSSACTQKYQTYSVIKKSEFKFGEEHNPVTPKLYAGHKEAHEYCEGQFLFFSNAKKNSEDQLTNMLRFTCPQGSYVVDAKVTELWWTTLVYSRACIKLEAYCPLSPK